MQSLRCTNILLAVIAVCLVYQCVKFEGLPSAAATGYSTGATDVRVIGTVPVSVQNTVTTRLSGTGGSASPIDVNVKSWSPFVRAHVDVDEWSVSGAIRVRAQ